MKTKLLFFSLLMLATGGSLSAQTPISIVAGVVTADVGRSSNYKILVNQTVTSVVFTSISTPAAGQNVSLFFTENATGGFSVVFGGNISNPCTVVTTASTTTVCQFQYDATSATWFGVGGGGGGITPNSPVPANQAQGPTFNVKNYGATGDAQHVTDGVTAGGGSKTVTSATAAFKSTAVGQKIICVTGNNVTPIMPTATILSVTPTVATTDTSDNGAVSGLTCVWYTKDDTSNFQAATTAASPASGDNDPSNGKVILPLPGTVYCPEGGYAVSGRIFSFIGSGASIGPSFVGAGRNKCIIYVLPSTTDPNDGFSVVMNPYSSRGIILKDFTLDGLGFKSNFTHPIIQMFGNQQFRMENVGVTSISSGGSNFGTIDFTNAANGVIDNVFVQNAGGNNDFACGFNGSSGIVIRNITCSNHFQSLLVNNTGVRTVGGDNGIVFEGGTIDECGVNINCTVVSNSGLVNFYGTTLMQSANATNYALSVDGTSRAYLSNVTCGVFGVTAGTTNCMTIASGGEVDATMSDLRGNDSASTVGTAVNGPAGAKFVDVGGNKILHSVNGVISPVTAAQYATLGFTGGIVPKTTVHMPYNTCYAVTGNLLATAQNLCTLLLDQNYQLVNITAQSGGTTPANSACATPPVITLSDGTRTATLNMTTGKTQWSSAVDTVTNINQVFANATTLTVSIGANTCATPPVNVSVNYGLQSVLNP